MNREPNHESKNNQLKARYIFELDEDGLDRIKSAAAFHGKFISYLDHIFVAPREVQTENARCSIYHNDILAKAKKQLGKEAGTPDPERQLKNVEEQGLYDAGVFDVSDDTVTIFGESTLFGRGDTNEREKTADKIKDLLPDNYGIQFH